MRACLLILVFSFAAFCAFSQEPSLKSSIVTSQTPAHQNASGSRIHLVPPAGFEQMASFSGFQKAGTGAIIVLELGGDNDYKKNAATFTKEAFAAKGMTVLQSQDLTVNELNGKAVVAVKGDDGTKSIILLFGDSTFMAMITAVYPAGQKETEAAIVKSLESVWLNKDQKVDAFAEAKFTVKENTSRFKYIKSVGKMHVYTIDGVDPAQVTNTPMMILSQVPATGINATNLKAYTRGMMDSFRKKNGTDFVTNKSEGLTINGVTAWEIEETGKNDGKDVFVYNCVILGDGFTVGVSGVAKKDVAATVKDFETFARSIKLK